AQATAPNLYTRQLARDQRAHQALLEAERRRHLLRNAQQAAFDSLMRGNPGQVAGGTGFAPSPTPPPALTEAFERLVAGSLAQGGGRIDVATRQRLAAQAEAMGLTRFDANLLMARVGYYAGPGKGASAGRTGAFSGKAGRLRTHVPPWRRRMYRWSVLLASLL